MTTQHTHSEPNDVDTNAVSSSLAPTEGIEEASFVPTEVVAQADGTSADHSHTDAISTAAVPPTEIAPASNRAGTTESQETPAQAEPTTYAADLGDEQPVRPFDEILEEFRQSEARFQAAVQAYEVETPATPVKADSSRPSAPSEAESATDNKPSAPKEAAVSPLLRPAARLRMPRHSGGRVREVAPLTPVGTDSSSTPAPVETPPAAPTGEPAANTPAEETPRPPRRYRFDRPSTAASAVTATPPPAPRVENPHTIEPEVTPSPDAKAATPPARSARFNRHAEPPVGADSSHPTTPPEAPVASEQPSVVATPIDEAAATPPVPETEINPEDLPPLEYAELQKANSRRRRRSKHNGTTPVAAQPPVAVPAPPTQPAPKTTTPPPASPASSAASTAPVAVPRPIATPPAVPPGQHGILSGYTVNQMNQGDGVGPFMPPEPSPARGSTLSSSIRTPRVDRTGSNGRSTESAHYTLASLTSTITQAFQVQTDRMIAELRRANQTPTNITVSMPTLPSTERVGVFVDVANLLYSARTLRITVDFGKLLDFLRGNRRLVRAQAYCPTSPQPGDEQMFLQAVKGLGYRITTKNYKTFASGAKKADLDLDLCMDVVRLVDGKAVDSIVLVSGDSDFMPMLDYCSDHGVRVEVAAFDEAMSATLRQGCDLFVNLAMLEEIRA